MGTVTRNPSVMKHSLLLSTVALAAVSAQQQGYKPQPQPQQGYRPQPVEEVEVPRPYKYQYGVKDDYSSSNFAKTETQDDKGNVAGTFVIALPDGRIQTTKYTADPILGFIAELTYQGEPVYPPPPAEGYPGEQPRRLNAIN